MEKRVVNAADSCLSQAPNPQIEEIAPKSPVPALTTTPEESTRLGVQLTTENSNPDSAKAITCTPAKDAEIVVDETQDPSALSQHFLDPNPPPTQENPSPILV